MAASPTANATVGVEPMGSHFVVTTVPGDGLAGAMQTLPHVLRDPVREPHRWSAPAVPVVARAVRALVAMHPWIAVDADAERLLGAVEALPEGATAVAHFCEHKPGVPGVVIAMEPDPELRAVFSGLPDAGTTRCWIGSGSPRARRRWRRSATSSTAWARSPPRPRCAGGSGATSSRRCP